VFQRAFFQLRSGPFKAATMTATSQAFMASDILSTPGFFTAAISTDENVNPFETSFKAGTSTLDRSQDSQLRPDDHHTHGFAGLSSNAMLQSMKTDSYSPLFGFSPRMSPTPYEDHTHLASKTANAQAPDLWGSSKQELQLQLSLQPAVQLQVPSPPNSEKHSPDQWQFNDLPQPMFSPLHQILTQSHNGHPRAEYGQDTPPNDRSPEDGDSHREEHEEQLAERGRAMKRKRGSPLSQSGEVADKHPSKRSRKSVFRTKSQSLGATEASVSPIEDAKRSKFLERNRVAASKCRQKKKEWTSNLEVRARDLQTSKNRLTVMVGSLKEEILFLKGELLKHSSCGCTAIRDYLNREVASMSQPVYDRGHLAKRASAASTASSGEISTVGDDAVSCKGTVADDDGTTTSPASTQIDLKATSAVAASEFMSSEESNLNEVLAQHDSIHDAVSSPQ